MSTDSSPLCPNKDLPTSECVQSQTSVDHLISKTEEHDLSMQMSTEDMHGVRCKEHGDEHLNCTLSIVI